MSDVRANRNLTKSFPDHTKNMTAFDLTLTQPIFVDQLSYVLIMYIILLKSVLWCNLCIPEFPKDARGPS